MSKIIRRMTASQVEVERTDGEKNVFVIKLETRLFLDLKSDAPKVLGDTTKSFLRLHLAFEGISIDNQKILNVATVTWEDGSTQNVFFTPDEIPKYVYDRWGLLSKEQFFYVEMIKAKQDGIFNLKLDVKGEPIFYKRNGQGRLVHIKKTEVDLNNSAFVFYDDGEFVSVTKKVEPARDMDKEWKKKAVERSKISRTLPEMLKNNETDLEKIIRSVGHVESMIPMMSSHLEEKVEQSKELICVGLQKQLEGNKKFQKTVKALIISFGTILAILGSLILSQTLK